MIVLSISLLPKNSYPIPINYKGYLNNLLWNFLKESKEEFASNVTFSGLKCSRYEINDSFITFKNVVHLEISSLDYNIVSKLVQSFFNNPIIKLNKAEFEATDIGISEKVCIEDKNEFVLLKGLIQFDSEIA